MTAEKKSVSDYATEIQCATYILLDLLQVAIEASGSDLDSPCNSMVIAARRYVKDIRAAADDLCRLPDAKEGAQ